MKTFLQAGFILLFFVSTLLFAQSEKSDTTLTFRLSEVVVTATKTETPAYEIASSVTVITSEQIKQSKKHSVVEILRDVPGVNVVQQGGVGKLSYVYLRGGSPQHTLVLIDGIAMNNPSAVTNAYDFSHLQTDNIERIEILRGPQSTLYGSNALAGVINILTKKGKDTSTYSVSAEGGSYKSYKGSAFANGKISFINYSIGLTRFSTEGFSAARNELTEPENDGYVNNSISARFVFTPIENLNIDFFARFNDIQTDLDQSDKFGDDPNFIYTLEESSYKVAANYSLFEGLWKQNLSASFMRHLSRAKDEVDFNNPTTSSLNALDGKKTKIDWQNIISINQANNFVFGIETETEKASSDYQSESTWGPYSSVFPEKSLTTSGFYGQYQTRIMNTFFATAGVRYDKHQKFGSVLTYRIAPAFMIWETGTKLKATFGTGFKSPSLFYLFDPFFGNEDLNPEKSTGFDAGIEQYFLNGKVIFSATYFKNNFKNLFGFDQNFKAINIDKAETKGVEAYIELEPFNNLKINLNYTFTESKDKSDDSPEKGLQLLRRAKHKAGLHLNYSFIEKANAYFEIFYTGNRDDKDFYQFPAERVTLKPFTVVNLAASYELTNYLQLYTRLENIFNENYEEVLFYNTPKRSAFLGVRFTF